MPDVVPGVPFVRTKLTNTLAESVIDLIRQRGLQSGDRLPSVSSLAERFQVAVPTMREALRRLEVTGMLDIRHGSGIYVRQDSARVMLPNPYHGELEPQTILDLLEARRHIEPMLAEKAAHFATAAELGAMKSLLDEAEAHLGGNKADDSILGQINMRFHRAIAAAARNSVLSQIIVSLTELHFKDQMVVLDLYNDRRHDHEQHKIILKALSGGQAAKANKLMTQHLENVMAVVKEKLERRQGKP